MQSRIERISQRPNFSFLFFFFLIMYVFHFFFRFLSLFFFLSFLRPHAHADVMGLQATEQPLALIMMLTPDTVKEEGATEINGVGACLGSSRTRREKRNGRSQQASRMKRLDPGMWTIRHRRIKTDTKYKMFFFLH